MEPPAPLAGPPDHDQRLGDPLHGHLYGARVTDLPVILRLLAGPLHLGHGGVDSHGHLSDCLYYLLGHGGGRDRRRIPSPSCHRGGRRSEADPA